jgi:hypothetical protein
MNTLKNQLAVFALAVTMALLAVIGTPAVGNAQTEMRADIPFDFYIGAQQLPSGSYSFVVSGMYIKVSDRNGHSAMTLASTVPNPESRTLNGAKLMFTRYDNYFFLSEVRRGGYSTGLGLIRSHLETQIAKSSGNRQLLAFGTTQ